MARVHGYALCLLYLALFFPLVFYVQARTQVRRSFCQVLNKKCGYQDILVTMFDYCLRDAAGYFEIVSKWNNKFPLVIKDAITRDSLYYLVNDGKRAAGLSAC
jgi:hypothetical protein